MIGFNMDEVMSGTHVYADESDLTIKAGLPFHFEITWGPEDILNWLNPFGGSFLAQPLHGHITVGGLCEKVFCMGNLYLEYWKGQIRYEIFFRHNGRSYKYEGEKTGMRPWNLHRTHTTCHGILVNLETGEIISKSVVYFRFHTMPKFLRSFRLRRIDE
jgi:hypothetical protein